MFGHHDDTKTDENQVPDAAIQAVSDDSNSSDQATPTPALQHPGTPLEEEPANEANGNVLSPAGGFPRSTSNQVMEAGNYHAPIPVPDPPHVDDTVSASDTDLSNLVNIKQMALNELLPLIDKLDQPPEERFRTIMMLIQASDNKELIDKAYEAAHNISDEKTRAQALLDIVNEINYFTAPHDN